MNVLLLPYNIASDISHKVRALKSIGINARGLTFGSHTIQTHTDVKVLPGYSSNPVINRFNQVRAFAELYRAIKWSDVIHWLWDFGTLPLDLDKKVLKFFDKPGVIQWCGSDIRIPEVDFEVNPFYESAFNDGYEYTFESRENSLRNQRNFAEVGFYPLEFIGTAQYIDRNLFPNRFQTWQPLVLSEHSTNYPNPNKEKPLIIHSPSAPFAKGTKHVTRAIENLKLKYEFEFVLVQGMEREKALQIMSQCDIFIDQLILGIHGYAAVEAMAFGKPVIGYINSVIGKEYPSELPIVSASPETITEKLEVLVKDASLRHELGKKGRAYVEKYHDEKKVAKQLVEIYREVIHLHQDKQGRKV